MVVVVGDVVRVANVNVVGVLYLSVLFVVGMVVVVGLWRWWRLSCRLHILLFQRPVLFQTDWRLRGLHAYG